MGSLKKNITFKIDESCRAIYRVKRDIAAVEDARNTLDSRKQLAKARLEHMIDSFISNIAELRDHFEHAIDDAAMFKNVLLNETREKLQKREEHIAKYYDVLDNALSNPGKVIEEDVEKAIESLTDVLESTEGSSCDLSSIQHLDFMTQQKLLDNLFADYTAFGYVKTGRINIKDIKVENFMNKSFVGIEEIFLVNLGQASVSHDTDCLTCNVIGPNNKTLDAHIARTSDGKFTIKYTPQLTGLHNVIVKVFDQNIPGSPFMVNAMVFKLTYDSNEESSSNSSIVVTKPRSRHTRVSGKSVKALSKLIRIDNANKERLNTTDTSLSSEAMEKSTQCSFTEFKRYQMPMRKPSKCVQTTVSPDKTYSSVACQTTLPQREVACQTNRSQFEMACQTKWTKTDSVCQTDIECWCSEKKVQCQQMLESFIREQNLGQKQCHETANDIAVETFQTEEWYEYVVDEYESGNVNECAYTETRETVADKGRMRCIGDENNNRNTEGAMSFEESTGKKRSEVCDWAEGWDKAVLSKHEKNELEVENSSDWTRDVQRTSGLDRGARTDSDNYDIDSWDSSDVQMSSSAITKSASKDDKHTQYRSDSQTQKIPGINSSLEIRGFPTVFNYDDWGASLDTVMQVSNSNKEHDIQDQSVSKTHKVPHTNGSSANLYDDWGSPLENVAQWSSSDKEHDIQDRSVSQTHKVPHTNSCSMNLYDDWGSPLDNVAQGSCSNKEHGIQDRLVSQTHKVPRTNGSSMNLYDDWGSPLENGAQGSNSNTEISRKGHAIAPPLSREFNSFSQTVSKKCRPAQDADLAKDDRALDNGEQYTKEVHDTFNNHEDSAYKSISSVDDGGPWDDDNNTNSSVNDSGKTKKSILHRCASKKKRFIKADYIRTIGSPARRYANSERILSYPIGVTMSSNHDVIVANNGLDNVKVFGYEGECKLTIGHKNEFERPSAVVTNSDGDIFIKDNKQIRVYDSSGTLKNCFGEYYLTKPYGLAITDAGHILTLDHGSKSKNAQLVLYDQNGYIMSTKPFRQADGLGPRCRFLACRGDRIVVTDLGEDRVHIANMDGEVIKTFGSYGSLENCANFSGPSGVFIDQDGYIMIADSKNDRVQVFSPDGHPTSTLQFSQLVRRLSDIHLTDDGYLLVSSFFDHCVNIYKLLED